jgi:tripartite-type tricarboxylate transporter receptor subunit TctC
MFISAPPAVPHIKSGKLRALGVASAERMPALPDVPTMIEAGLPGFEVTARYGIVAPAATPKDIIDKLNAGLVQILQTQEAKDRFAALGLRTMSDTPAEFASYIRTEIAKWAKVAKAARLTPQ